MVNEWTHLSYLGLWGTGKARSFIKSNEIVNREELQRALDAIVEDRGQFVCL
jgi:hypothetical protein